MGVRKRGHVLILERKVMQQCNDVKQLSSDDTKRLTHNHNVGVVTHIAGGSAKVNDTLRLRAL